MYKPYYYMRAQPEGHFRSSNREHSEWPLFAEQAPNSDAGKLPRESDPAADISIQYDLRWFLGKKMLVRIQIENKFSPEGSIWHFQEIHSAFERSLNSQNLDDLQTVFNDLLRAVMKALSRRVS